MRPKRKSATPSASAPRRRRAGADGLAAGLDRPVLFLGVHPEHRPPWLALRGLVSRLGVRWVDGENLNRARFHLETILRAGSHRVVAVLDPFEDWPFEPWQRRNSPREYADFLFEARRRTRGTPDAVAFLLYHHSRAPAEDDHGLCRDELASLREHPAVHRDLAEERVAARLVEAWERLREELLRGAPGG